jgi:AAA domain/UvrD-like helicase C-terminal domain
MTDPALDAIRRRIAGPEPLLLIEAPAGYGKTHEAVLAAQTLAPTLPAGRKILFLTHTNAARETFNRRLKGGAAVMRTIHALACELVELYAAPLCLPRPLEPYRDKPSFDDMITLAVTLLQRRPELARGLAVRHPVILVDEYQDCVQAQHELIALIARAAPTRLRLFGDDLQAIFEFAGTPVDFAAMTRAHPTVRLTTPWRWVAQPEMADFVVHARSALAAGEPIDLTATPSCVSIHVWDGPVPGPNQAGHAEQCLKALRACLGERAVALTHHNSHALGLRRRMPHHGRYHEGADHEPARITLAAVGEAEGNAPALAALLITAMHEWGQGMTKPYRDGVAAICTPGGVELGSRAKLTKLAEICRELYAEPTVARWLHCLRRVLNGEHGIPGWKVLRGDQIYLLARLRPGPKDDPGTLLHAESQARSAIRPAPRRGFMVIHKAKGFEFDEVAIPYCAGALFADDLASRRRMYVAISRAQRRLHFLIPRSDPTPLLRH